MGRRPRRLQRRGSISACLDVWGPDPCGDARALLSSRGVAGCVGVYGYHVGAGATWDFDFDAFTGCDLAPYASGQAGACGRSRSAQSNDASRRAAERGLGGHRRRRPDGRDPDRADGGQSVSVSRSMPVVQNDKFYAQLRQDGTTFVLVDKPAAGGWTLTDDGTAPVKLVREARGLPEAAERVTGSRGRGAIAS